MPSPKRRDFHNVCSCGRSFLFFEELYAHVVNSGGSPRHQFAITVFTCDSHETFGPFASEVDAKAWARARQLSSWTVHKGRAGA